MLWTLCERSPRTGLYASVCIYMSLSVLKPRASRMLIHPFIYIHYTKKTGIKNHGQPTFLENIKLRSKLRRIMLLNWKQDNRSFETNWERRLRLTLEIDWRSRQSKRLFVASILATVYGLMWKESLNAPPKVVGFPGCSSFLPQGKLTGWVRINTINKVISQLL
jgi:hypothetical protein